MSLHFGLSSLPPLTNLCSIALNTIVNPQCSSWGWKGSSKWTSNGRSASKQTKSETKAVIFHHNGWVLEAGKKKVKEKKKGSHGCCGRKGALAIGAGIAAAMAIVASKFNTDHPNMLEPTKSIPTGAEYVWHWTLNLDLRKSQHILMRLRKMVFLLHFCSVCWGW